ncbi:pyridoxal phosphate enzyme (YggS family) [Nakamurella sp. UYEF19]|uniref:YggS family pyridoxal phosphate-dependent enzyme n=1 Tax=Nakamurella sp. UYEF19 TaxID=1756392 RepID=UPI003391E5B8
MPVAGEAAAAPPGDPDLRRLADVIEQVAAAAVAAGRSPADVRLLLATKTIDPDRILRVLGAGHRLIGENRAQEVVAKADALAPSEHECHFIGHLQANKINQVLPHVSCVQTVDSAELGRRLHSRAELLDRTLDVMVQVNVSGEDSKSGIALAQAPELLATLAGFDRLRVRGYMTIGLNSPDLAAVRAGYRSLADFRDGARSKGLAGAEQATELSMGMSGDFAAAIAEGSTMVRLGSAVFGRRAPNGPPQPEAAR